jgi:hypothetical protein
MRKLVCVYLLLVGCDLTGPRAKESAGSAVGEVEVGLYSDAVVRALAPHDIDQATRAAEGIFDVPCLEVVPNGESRPRGEIFRSLGLDDRRLREFRVGAEGFVVFLWWQVSPSYDIVCMSATNDAENSDLEFTDPKLKVYGIRLVARDAKFRPMGD